MADNWEETADAVNRAVTGAVKSLEDVFEKERTVYGGASLAESVLGSVGIGNGFRFPSVEDANKIINSFKDRQDSMERRRQHILDVKSALRVRFAEDDVSTSYIEKAMESLGSLDALNESAIQYTEGYIDKLQRAKRAKVETEEETSSSFDRAVGHP